MQQKLKMLKRKIGELFVVSTTMPKGERCAFVVESMVIQPTNASNVITASEGDMLGKNVP